MLRVLHIANNFDVKLGGSNWSAFKIMVNANGGSVVCELVGTVHRGSDTAAHFTEHFPQHNNVSLGLQHWLQENAGT